MTKKSEKQIFIFHGADVGRMGDEVRRYKIKFKEKYGSQASVMVWQSDEDGSVDEVLSSGSLFSPAKLTVIKNPITTPIDQSPLNPEKLLGLLDKQLSVDNFVLVVQEGGFDKRTKFSKEFLKKASESPGVLLKEFSSLEEKEALSLLAKELAQEGYKLKLDAGKLLYRYCCNSAGDFNWSRASQALAQLKDYLGEERTVTVESVNELIRPLAEEDAFLPLLKAFASGHKKDFHLQLEKVMKAASSEQELLGVISALFEQTKNMIMVRTLKPEMSLKEVDKVLGFKPGRSQFIERDSRGYKLPELYRLLDELITLEAEFKQGRMPLAQALPHLNKVRY